MSENPIASYAQQFSAKSAAICDLLCAEIGAAMPKATARIWHAMPVWFIGENPVVGYKVTPKYLNLLFWNGQSFDEPGLRAAGKFKAAQAQFTDATQIDVTLLRRWLRKARTDVWDSSGLRRRKAGT